MSSDVLFKLAASRNICSGSDIGDGVYCASGNRTRLYTAEILAEFVLISLNLGVEGEGGCSGGSMFTDKDLSDGLRLEGVVHSRSATVDSRLLRKNNKIAIEMTRKKPPHNPPISRADAVDRDVDSKDA